MVVPRRPAPGPRSTCPATDATFGPPRSAPPPEQLLRSGGTAGPVASYLSRGPSRRRSRRVDRHPDDGRPGPRHRAREGRDRVVRVGRVGDPKLPRVLVRHPAGRARAPHDQETADLHVDAELGEAFPRRERVGLRFVPPNELLEPAQLRLELRGEDYALARLVEDEVDPAATRSAYGHLGEGLPPRVAAAEEQLEHRRLVTVVDPGARVREEPHREVRPEDCAEARVRARGRHRLVVQDPRQVRAWDPAFEGERSLRDAGVGHELLELLDQHRLEVMRSRFGGFLHIGRRHHAMMAGFAYRSLNERRVEPAVAPPGGPAPVGGPRLPARLPIGPSQVPDRPTFGPDSCRSGP